MLFNKDIIIIIIIIIVIIIIIRGWDWFTLDSWDSNLIYMDMYTNIKKIVCKLLRVLTFKFICFIVLVFFIIFCGL